MRLSSHGHRKCFVTNEVVKPWTHRKCFVTNEVANPWTHRENVLLLMKLPSDGHTEKMFCY